MSREIETYFPSHLHLLQKCCNLLIKFTLHFIFDIISQRDKNKKAPDPFGMTREEVIENSAGASWVHSPSVRQKQRVISVTEKTPWPH